MSSSFCTLSQACRRKEMLSFRLRELLKPVKTSHPTAISEYRCLHECVILNPSRNVLEISWRVSMACQLIPMLIIVLRTQYDAGCRENPCRASEKPSEKPSETLVPVRSCRHTHRRPFLASSTFLAISPGMKPPLLAQMALPSPNSTLSSTAGNAQGQ